MATDPDDTEMRHSATDGRYSGFDRDGPDESGEPPPRFGRLALCIAAAGALTFGREAAGEDGRHDQRQEAGHDVNHPPAAEPGYDT